MSLKRRASWEDSHIEILSVPTYDPDHQPINVPSEPGPLPGQGGTPAPGAHPPFQLPQTSSEGGDDIVLELLEGDE